MNVFEYCKSDFIIGAFEQNDYLIIQIDTDCCEEKHFDISRRNDDGTNSSPAEMITKVLEKFNEIFSSYHPEKYKLFKDRLLFAICVEEIECWLLPLYHSDKTKEATYSCVRKLNPKLEAQFGVFIDKDNKSHVIQHYRKFSKPFSKRKKIDEILHDNFSLTVFLNNLGKVDLN